MLFPIVTAHIYISINNVHVFSFLYIPTSTCFLLSFWLQTSVKWYFIVLLTYVSLLISNVEHVPSPPPFLPSSFFFISFPNYFDIFIYTNNYIGYVLCVLSHSFMSHSLRRWTVAHQASQIVQWPKSGTVWKKFLDWPARYYCGGPGGIPKSMWLFLCAENWYKHASPFWLFYSL